MKVILTTNFELDINSIDEFLVGKINQNTWQSEPLRLGNKKYIIHRPILDSWVESNNKSVQEIDFNSEQNQNKQP